MVRKFFLLLILAAWSVLRLPAAQPVDYQRSDSLKVVSLLTGASQLQANTNYVLYFARQLRGLPYVAKTLEKNSEERLVVNLRQMDCTTYTETVLALALCMQQRKPNFAAFCQNLRQLRYKDGMVSYPNRLHYFTTWMEENQRKGLVTCIDKPATVFTATQTVRADYMTTHVNLYPMLVAHPNWVAPIRDMEQQITGRQYKYIPKSRLNDTALLKKAIQNGDIIVILTSKRGLDTSHIGIAVWHTDGLHLLNASQIRGRVVEETKSFYQYMKEHATHTGIRVARLVK